MSLVSLLRMEKRRIVRSLLRKGNLKAFTCHVGEGCAVLHYSPANYWRSFLCAKWVKPIPFLGTILSALLPTSKHGLQGACLLAGKESDWSDSNLQTLERKVMNALQYYCFRVCSLNRSIISSWYSSSSFVLWRCNEAVRIRIPNPILLLF